MEVYISYSFFWTPSTDDREDLGQLHFKLKLRHYYIDINKNNGRSIDHKLYLIWTLDMDTPTIKSLKTIKESKNLPAQQTR